MCMEDVRLGRESAPSEIIIPFTGTSKLAIPGSPKRTVLILCGGVGDSVTFSLSNPAVAGQGITIPSNGSPVRLNVQHDGLLVTMPWYCVGAAAGATAAAYQCLLDKT